MKLKRLFIFLIIILSLAILSYFYPYLTGNVTTNNQPQTTYQKEPAIVLKVIDGDTIETNLGTIRLLGINTPEKNKPYYQEAKDFLSSKIQNRTIEILRDKEDIDRYNRKLRYVFYKDSLINIEIVSAGFATTFMIDELKYKDKFIMAEKFARENEIGMWKKSTQTCANCIILLKLEPIEDYFILKNSCNKLCNLTGWVIKDDANHFTYPASMNPNEEKEYKSKTEIWNDAGDRFFMRDNIGELVVFYEY